MQLLKMPLLLVTAALTVGCATTGSVIHSSDIPLTPYKPTGNLGVYYNLDYSTPKERGIDSIEFDRLTNTLLITSHSYSLYNEYSGPELSNGQKVVVDILKSDRTGKKEWRAERTKSLTLIFKGSGINKRLEVRANKNGVLETSVSAVLENITEKGSLTIVCESCETNFSKRNNQNKQIPEPPKVTTSLIINLNNTEISDIVNPIFNRAGDAAISRIKIAAENNRILREGDGTPDDELCKRYGFKPSSEAYGQCRLQIDTAKQQAAQQQEIYEQQRRQYEAQVAAADREKNQRRSAAMFEFGMRMLSGQSAASAAATVGTGAPLGPPQVPVSTMQYMLPGNKMMTCTTTGNMTNCF